MKTILLLSVLAMSILFPAYSEGNLTQSLRGSVKDAVTGIPLIGATVVILNSDPIIGAVSNQNGEFHLKDVPLGRHSIEVSYIGYHNAIINNTLLSSGKETVLSIVLEEKAYAVEELTIRPERKKVEALNDMAMVSARTFSVEETERFAGSLGDPARMVANYAGVMTQNDARNDIIIRGNSPSGVLWRLEGIEIANPNHFGALGTTGGPVSMVNNNLLADSDFLTGAFPAEFGNALAGAFDLNLRSGNNQKTEFTGQVGFNGFEAGVEGPFKIKDNGPNPSYMANFRYSTLELMHELGFSTGTGSAIPEYQDLTFIVDLPGTKAGRFKVFGLMGKSFIALGHDVSDTLDNSYNARRTTTDFGSDLNMAGITHTIYLTEKSKLKSSFSAQNTSAKTKIDSIQPTDIYSPFYRSEQSEGKISFSSQYLQKISARDNFSIGLVADFYRLNFSDSVREEKYENRFITLADGDGSLALIRSFAQYQHKFPNNITAYGGVHVQHTNLNNEVSFEPRLGMKWPAGKKGDFNLGFGIHSQLQPKSIYFNQTYIEETDSYIQTNRDVGFTKSNHYVAGYNYLFSKNLRIKIESYYQSLYKVPVKESFEEFSMLNAGDQFGLPREDSLINTGKGQNYGLELTLERFLNKGYYFLFTASLFESQYQGFDKIWRNTAFNGNYVFNLLGGYEFRLGEKTLFTIDSKTVFAGGKRYVPVNIEESILQNTEVRDWENAYKDKYEPYFRTDVRIGIKTNAKKYSQEFGIDLQNVTNYRSIFMEGFDNVEEKTYKVYQQGFVPMFLYRIQF